MDKNIASKCRRLAEELDVLRQNGGYDSEVNYETNVLNVTRNSINNLRIGKQPGLEKIIAYVEKSGMGWERFGEIVGSDRQDANKYSTNTISLQKTGNFSIWEKEGKEIACLTLQLLDKLWGKPEVHKIKEFLQHEIERAETPELIGFEGKLKRFLLGVPATSRVELEQLIKGSWNGDRAKFRRLIYAIVMGLFKWTGEKYSAADIEAIAQNCEEEEEELEKIHY